MQEQTTIRVSLPIVLTGLVIVFAIGATGGVVGFQFSSPAGSALTSSRENIVSTTQQVTISPSTSATALVEKNRRSILLLAQQQGESSVPAGSGIIMTNDGVIASPVHIARDPIAIDDTGKTEPLSTIGRDELFGMTYYRFTNGVFPAIELAEQSPGIASHLLAVGRSSTTYTPQARGVELIEYTLPGANAALGIQRVMQLPFETRITLPGEGLLSDDGKLVGIVTDPTSGNALTIGDVRASLSRAISGKREYNPYQELGLRVTYEFTPSFTATVQSIAAGSPAAIAGLATGDNILKIGDQDVTWSESIVQLLDTQRPFSITINRADTQHTLTINE